MAAPLEVPNGNVVTRPVDEVARVHTRANRLLTAEVVEKAAMQQWEFLRRDPVYPGDHEHQEQVEECHCCARGTFRTGFLILRAASQARVWRWRTILTYNNLLPGLEQGQPPGRLEPEPPPPKERADCALRRAIREVDRE